MAHPKIHIRPATRSDDDGVWKIFHAVIKPGDTLAFDPAMSREDGLAFWFRADTHAYVAEINAQIAGSYFIRANQPGLGSHVANAGFIVSPEARGLGIGRRMGEHCLAEARRMGFRAMQFNIVVATNAPAVHLWQELGFRIIGTLPGVFRHAQLGFVDAHVMFRSLDE